MNTFFFRIEEKRDGDLYVVVARDKKGHFLGVVSEETKKDALRESKMLALEGLLDLADQGYFPLEGLYTAPPKSGGIQVTLQDLFPILLRFKRCQRGLTQSAVAGMLDVRQQAYARLERPGKSNPTLSTVERLSSILKDDLLAPA